MLHHIDHVRFNGISERAEDDVVMERISFEHIIRGSYEVRQIVYRGQRYIVTSSKAFSFEVYAEYQTLRFEEPVFDVLSRVWCPVFRAKVVDCGHPDDVVNELLQFFWIVYWLLFPCLF